MRVEDNSQSKIEKLVWTDMDTQVVKSYKEKVRNGEIHPTKYTGNLKDILNS